MVTWIDLGECGEYALRDSKVWLSGAGAKIC